MAGISNKNKKICFCRGWFVSEDWYVHENLFIITTRPSLKNRLNDKENMSRFTFPHLRSICILFIFSERMTYFQQVRSFSVIWWRKTCIHKERDFMVYFLFMYFCSLQSESAKIICTCCASIMKLKNLLRKDRSWIYSLLKVWFYV